MSSWHAKSSARFATQDRPDQSIAFSGTFRRCCLSRSILMVLPFPDILFPDFFFGQRRCGAGACARGVRRRRLRCRPRATGLGRRLDRISSSGGGRCGTMWDARFRTADCTQNTFRSSRIRHMLHVLRNTGTMSSQRGGKTVVLSLSWVYHHAKTMS